MNGANHSIIVHKRTERSPAYTMSDGVENYFSVQTQHEQKLHTRAAGATVNMMCP